MCKWICSVISFALHLSVKFQLLACSLGHQETQLGNGFDPVPFLFHIFSDTGLKRGQVILTSQTVVWPDAWPCPGEWADKLDFSETQHYRKNTKHHQNRSLFQGLKGV